MRAAGAQQPPGDEATRAAAGRDAEATAEELGAGGTGAPGDGAAADRLEDEREQAAEREMDAGRAGLEDPVERRVAVAAREEAATTSEPAAFQAAYAWLAEAETSGKTDGLDGVKRVFEAEIEAGRNLARAHNGLGRAYLLEHDHAITILESIQKLFNWDHVTRARKHFRLATETDPGYVEAWYNWARAGRKAKDGDALREAAAALRRVVDLDPGYRDAYRLLAVTWRDLGEADESERALAEWRASPAANVSLANLEQAHLALGVRERPAEGARLYWEGLRAAVGPEEVDAYFEDLRLITTEKDREAYRALEVEGRKEWIERFWERQADEAVVTRDERLAEHYRRLSHVERNFTLRIPQRRHYSAIAAYRPREQSGFDDRGVIYLRHGEPDRVARFSGPNVQRNESWRYRRGDGDLVFHFVSDEDTEDFKLVTSLTDALVRGAATLGQRRNSSENVGELFESRAGFDPMYNRLAFQFDPMLLREEEEEVARDVKVGTSTASYVPASPDSLPFYTYPAVFRGEAGAPELHLYIGVPTEELEMAPASGKTRFALAAQMLVAREDGDEGVAARAVDSLAVELPEALPRDKGVLLPEVLRAQVAPGEYDWRLRVQDLLSRNTGTARGEVEVPEFQGLSASTLVLATRVEPASSPGKFDRGGLKVVPLPSLLFRPDQPFFVYYELYGLTPGGDGRLRYRTEYVVRARERKRSIAVRLLGSVGDLVGSRKERGGEVGLAVESQAAAAERLREYVALDLNESEPGPYELVVRVEDLATGDKVERRTPFVLAR